MAYLYAAIIVFLLFLPVLGNWTGTLYLKLHSKGV